MMKNRLIVDLDNTITIDSSSPNYESKKINAEVARAIHNASKLGISSTIFSARNMNSLEGDLLEIEEITRPIAEKWLKENHVPYSDLILGKPWCGPEGWYVDDKNLSIEEFTFKYTSPFWNKSVDLIVPFFNEESAVPKVHFQNKKSERLFNINNYIYIENGSTDNTRERLKELAENDKKIKLILLEKNLGYGGGIKAGLAKSSSSIVILNHADLQFDLYSFIYTNLDIITIQNKTNILSKRLNRGFKDRVYSALLRAILSIILFKRIKDFNGQPKVFNRSFLGPIDNLPNNFCIDLAIYKKIFLHSIQIPIIQSERKIGESSWSGSVKKRIQIFIDYILWAVTNR